MFALIVGVLVGTYSSLFIATPVMFDTTSKKKKA
jgi:SecD/SecF fusion protein